MLVAGALFAACTAGAGTDRPDGRERAGAEPARTSGADSGRAAKFTKRLVAAAIERTNHRVRYDPAYRAIDYPGGDVPADTGVCTDVVIRAYRTVGFDFQEAVYEDMKAAFDVYPKRWGLKRPDPNIDHRRVPNLEVYLERYGEALPVTRGARDYEPGDIVTWVLPGNLPHIGIVVDRRARNGRPMVVHNIGRGPVLEDMLFDYPITGHFRFVPDDPR